MCIIAHKAKGVDCPSNELIKTCFENNPDGAGVAILRPTSKVVEIHKGFMNVRDFLDFVNSAVTPKDIAAYHFRITTSGGTNPQNCHPFPISDNVRDLKALSTTARFAFVHNGVIGAGSDSLSDTQLYVKDVLARIRMKSLTKNIVDRIAQETEGSRTLTIDAQYAYVAMTGKWIYDDETGLSFSNSSYEKRYYKDFEAYFGRPIQTVCPDCQSIEAELISDYHGLYECPDCNCLFEEGGSVWAIGGLD